MSEALEEEKRHAEWLRGRLAPILAHPDGECFSVVLGAVFQFAGYTKEEMIPIVQRFEDHDASALIGAIAQRFAREFHDDPATLEKIRGALTRLREA